jgi:DNA (cytosine-5)-methyltransferase 1
VFSKGCSLANKSKTQNGKPQPAASINNNNNSNSNNSNNNPHRLKKKNKKFKPRFTFVELFAGIGGFRVALEEGLGGKCVFASEISAAARETYVANFGKRSPRNVEQRDGKWGRIKANGDGSGGGENAKEEVEDETGKVGFNRNDKDEKRQRENDEIGQDSMLNEDAYEVDDDDDSDELLVGDITEIEDIPPHDILTAGFPCQSFCKAGTQTGLEDARGELFFEVVRVLDQCRPKAFILENVANLVTLEDGEVFKVIKEHLEMVGYK